MLPWTIGKWTQGVYHVRRKFKSEYIMSGGNLSGVYHFYTMAVTAPTTYIDKNVNESTTVCSLRSLRSLALNNCTYVKTTMRMLTILREAEEWTRVYLREARLLFAISCNYEKLALHTSKQQSARTSNNFLSLTLYEPFSSVQSIEGVLGPYILVRIWSGAVRRILFQVL